MKEKNNFLEGSVFKGLIRFAIPVLGALILQAAYGAVDLLVVGRFGDASGISAVGTASSFMHMVTVVLASLAMGATVMIGQHIGEKKPEQAGNVVGTAIILFAGIGIVVTALIEIFAGSIVSVMQVPAESVEKATQYIRICGGGVLIIIAYNVISGILRGIGNANLPLLFVAIACVVNVFGDLFFVGVLRMDAAGAAIATILAQLISVIASVIVLARKDLGIVFTRKQYRVNRTELHKILGVGAPIAIQEALVQVSFLVINITINHMGLMESAGYGVAQKLIGFIMLIPSSVMQSVSAFVAQNIGAEQEKRAKQGFRTAMLTGCAFGSVIFLLGFFSGGWMSRLFSSDSEVILQSARYLKGFSIDCVLTCILFSSIGYFNGCGKSIPVMLQGITSAFCVRIPVSIAMSKLSGPALMYVGMATPITTVYGILFFVVVFFIFKQKKNKELGGKKYEISGNR